MVVAVVVAVAVAMAVAMARAMVSVCACLWAGGLVGDTERERQTESAQCT